MKSSTATWTVTVTAAALLALPCAALAQTAPTQPPASAQATQPTDTQGTASAAQDHLRQAKAALDQVTTASLSPRARTQVAELKKRLNTLERSVSANDSAGTTGATSRNPTATTGSRGKTNWGTEVAAIDKTLTAMLDASATPALDDATRTKLTEFRTHITAFAAAMSGAPAPAEPASAAAPATTPQQPPATQPQASTPQPQASAPAQTAAAQPNTDAARKHLTEARNTLSQLTQLPAASQLSGEARTQVSQLISNFNELITTQSDWKAPYGKVAANLTALLGPDTGTSDPASTSGAAGAVGTSGAGLNVDPAIRAKLVEIRRQLGEFERAAGGGAAASTAAPAANPSATPPSQPAPPTTTPPAPPTPTPEPAAPATQPATAADASTHLAAIEALFKSQNEGGGVTLDKAQVEMLRMHLAELRKLIDKK